MQRRIQAVREDREHGSRWLVRETIQILRDLAIRVEQEQDSQGHNAPQLAVLYDTGRQLAQARPAMAALAHAVGRVLHVQGGAAGMKQAANRLLHDYDTATTRITEHATPFLHGTVLTCSISGTVLEVLSACKGSISRVIALEGRPRYEGREMAQSLAKHEIPLTVITDAEADIFMPLSDMVVVGADSVLANGDVLNKAGTALLGWSAQGHTIPFYVLCETLKIAPYLWSTTAYEQNLAMLEEKEGSEVWAQPLQGVTVRNFYFDHTPANLVSKVITEQGVLSRQEIERIAQQARDDAQFLAATQ
jgi:translation initiation factor 2B subunit (eIF-2B alpha/beta/delta family)